MRQWHEMIARLVARRRRSALKINGDPKRGSVHTLPCETTGAVQQPVVGDPAEPTAHSAEHVELAVVAIAAIRRGDALDRFHAPGFRAPKHSWMHAK